MHPSSLIRGVDSRGARGAKGAMALPEILEFLSENTISLSIVEKITHLAPLVLKISHLDPRLQKAIYTSGTYKLWLT